MQSGRHDDKATDNGKPEIRSIRAAEEANVRLIWRMDTALLVLAFGFLIPPAEAAAPAVETLDGGVRLWIDTGMPPGPATRPAVLVIYATPNGNSIEQTLGGKPAAGGEGGGGPAMDWHYDIQHIAAQTQRWRELNTRQTIALAVVEAPGRSWPAFRKTYGEDAPRLDRKSVV